MKKKIGIVTWYDSINYGTCLQAYALYKFFVLNNFESFFPQNFNFYQEYSFQEYIYREVRHLIGELIRKKKNDFFKIFFKERLKKISNFINNFINVKCFKNKKEFFNCVKHTDIWVTGSDQIWNPNYLRTPYLLSFVPNSKLKIAYSSSIGVDKIPKNKEKIYKKYLSNFSHIAVREKTAQKELSKLLNRNIELVLDPVFLLDYSSWEELFISNSEMGIKGDDYIFCYFVGENQSWVDEVKKFAKERNLKIIVAISESGIIPDIGEAMPNLGVEEFVSCINNAKFVITDSFHASSLSIIFNKNFAVYKRFLDNDIKSQNSRLFDLLNTFNINNRLLINEYSLRDVLSCDIAYDEVNEILEEKKIFSKKYLLNAITEA